MGQLQNQPHCPACGELLDFYVATEPGATPKAGDLYVCAYCLAGLRFTASLDLEPVQWQTLTPEETQALRRTIHKARIFQNFRIRMKGQLN